MPDIRVMNWNVRHLSAVKLAIPGMTDALARTIFAETPDVVVLLEVRRLRVNELMPDLAESLNALAGGNLYTTWMLSELTGGEYYGFIIRDTNLVRPMQCALNPNWLPPPAPPLGTQANPIGNLQATRWTTWPNNVWPAAPAPAPVQGPSAPLIGPFVKPYIARGARRQRVAFAGQPPAYGGYAMGRGSRLPCLAIFHVHTAVGDYYIPIVCNHYAAVRSGRNQLGQAQFAQLPYLHIAQLFSWVDLQNPAPAERGYLDLDGQARTVEEIIFTGDFNVDFLQNQAGAPAPAGTNRTALNALTPTAANGTSQAPPALPGAAPPPPPPPAVPFLAPFAVAPELASISPHTLRAAVTSQGTMLAHFPKVAPVPPGTGIRGAAFDNFFYGGTVTSNATINFGAANHDAGNVIDVPAAVVQSPAGALPAIDLSEVAAFYANTHQANRAPLLQVLAGAGPALDMNDQWIGANLVSDHLPVVLEFECP